MYICNIASDTDSYDHADSHTDCEVRLSVADIPELFEDLSLGLEEKLIHLLLVNI